MVAQIDPVMLEKRRGKVLGRLVAWGLIEGRPLTTKGQWINPVVFALYRAAQLFPLRKGSDEPIFILGTGRSGTTILGKLFAMHQETVFLNEPKAAWHFIHGEEDLAGSYSQGPARIRLQADEAKPRMARKLAAIYSWAMRGGLARKVVDKYPELIFRLPFVQALFPKARFIAIVRDGVDTCASVTNWSRRKGDNVGGELHDWWGRDGRKWDLIVEQLVPEHGDLAPLQELLRKARIHQDRAAVEWIISMREAQRVAEAYPDTLLAVRYEELCLRPDEVLTEMLSHCGLSEDPVFRDYAKDVLQAAEAYDELRLMPELVGPFKATLVDMGYPESCERVVERT